MAMAERLASRHGDTTLLAFCMHAQQNAGMPTSITIRDVPDDVRDELASRAGLAGQSLQEHLRAELIALAQRPSVNMLLARIRDRKAKSGSKLPARAILAHRDRDRR
jgi:hypothetical protein